MRKIQKVLGAVVEPVIHMVDDIGCNKAMPKETYLDGLMDTMNLICAAIGYLSQSRKDVIRNDYGEAVQKICTWEMPVGVDQLFGIDVYKKLDEKDKVSLKCLVMNMRLGSGTSTSDMGTKTPIRSLTGVVRAMVKTITIRLPAPVPEFAEEEETFLFFIFQR